LHRLLIAGNPKMAHAKKPEEKSGYTKKRIGASRSPIMTLYAVDKYNKIIHRKTGNESRGIRMIFHPSDQNHRVRLQAAAAPLFALAGGSEENVQYMLGILVLCVAVGLFLGLLSWRASRTRRVEGQLKDEVLDALERVVAQHNSLTMYPMQRASNANAPTLSGYCVAYSPEGLQLACELTPSQPDWPHTAVDVYFHEIVDAERIFYAFTAYIQKMSVAGGRLLVDLPLPAYLRRAQKRSLFRINAQPDTLSALALWPMDPEHEHIEETTGRTLGRPVFAYRPQHLNLATVLDLSAGGVRLRLDADRCQQLEGGSPRPGDYFLMLTVFADQQGVTESRQFWFKCLCRHVGIHADSADPYMGLQFRAWSLTRELTEHITWHDVDEHGEVPPLFEWLVAHVQTATTAAGES